MIKYGVSCAICNEVMQIDAEGVARCPAHGEVTPYRIDGIQKTEGGEVEVALPLERSEVETSTRGVDSVGTGDK